MGQGGFYLLGCSLSDRLIAMMLQKPADEMACMLDCRRIKAIQSMVMHGLNEMVNVWEEFAAEYHII